MKQLITVLSLFIFSSWGEAQIFDVFQNKEYNTSMSVLDPEIDKDYIPSDLTVDIDENKDKNEDWSKIEEQLYSIAKQEIENRAFYFKLHNKALEYQSQLTDWLRLKGESIMYLTGSEFDNIEIELLSVLNNYGIYSINYHFEMKSRGYVGDQSISIKKYYLADYDKGKVISIGETPTQSQQEKLKTLTLYKFEKLYLLQTQKLDLNDLEKLRDVNKNKRIGIDFASKIHYSEAIVYPCFSGIIVEFPMFSNSTQPFKGLSFRVYLKGTEVQELLSVYPEFKSAFKKPLVPSSKTQIEQLDNDDNFDLSRFRTSPRELNILPILDFIQKVYTMKINSYQIIDTTKNFIGSKKTFFDKNEHVLLIEHRDRNKILKYEEKYKYNEKNQQISFKKTSFNQNLKLYHYKDDVLDYIENIDLGNEQDYNHKERNIEVSQKYFVYNDNYRYLIDIDLVGKFNPNGYNQIRYLEKNQFCTNSLCFLTDDSQKVVGVKQKRGSLIDLLTNSNNQPLESYFDYNRYRYFFKYDDQGRIQTFKSYTDATKSRIVRYEYHPKESKALIIRDEKTSFSDLTTLEHEYEFVFWDE